MINKGFSDNRGRFEYRIEARSQCRNCKFFGECTKSKEGRRLYRQATAIYAEMVAEHYQTPDGQKVYSQRKIKVELPFGHIKRNLGIQAFLMRRKEGVKAELSIIGSIINLTRLSNLAGGTQKAIQLLKTV